MNKDTLRRAVSAIWQIIQKEKTVSIAALKDKCKSLSAEDLYAGLGWLIKEESVALDQDNISSNIPAYSLYGINHL